MNPFTFLPVALVVTGLSFINTVAGATGEVFIVSEQPSNSIRQQIEYSARQFCRSTGGLVSEADGENIYLCCYVNKSKCVVTDTRRLMSWPVPYTEREQIQTKFLFNIDTH